jgi:hypothetical protein
LLIKEGSKRDRKITRAYEPSQAYLLDDDDPFVILT